MMGIGVDKTRGSWLTFSSGRRCQGNGVWFEQISDEYSQSRVVGMRDEMGGGDCEFGVLDFCDGRGGVLPPSAGVRVLGFRSITHNHSRLIIFG